MDDLTKQRMAENEDVFRQINEQIKSTALRHGEDQHRYEFLCECSSLNCVERVNVTVAEYRYARESPARFIVLKGHVLNEIEEVVEEARDHVFVEKQGEAGTVAIELDAPDDHSG